MDREWNDSQPIYRQLRDRVDKREFCVMHVFAQIAACDVEKIELQGFPVRRERTFHARPVACIAVMCQEEPALVQVEHRDRIVGTRRGHLVHYRISSRSRAKRDTHVTVLGRLGYRHVHRYLAFPRTRQCF